MIEATITTTGPAFPKLMRSMANDLIIIATGESDQGYAGIVVSGNLQATAYTIGYVGTTWRRDIFIDFEGAITLRNQV